MGSILSLKLYLTLKIKVNFAQNNRDLNQCGLLLWTKFYQPSLNRWVIVRTSKWLVHTHTDTGDDNTRRPKLASGNETFIRQIPMFHQHTKPWSQKWYVRVVLLFNIPSVIDHDDVLAWKRFPQSLQTLCWTVVFSSQRASDAELSWWPGRGDKETAVFL